MKPHFLFCLLLWAAASAESWSQSDMHARAESLKSELYNAGGTSSSENEYGPDICSVHLRRVFSGMILDEQDLWSTRLQKHLFSNNTMDALGWDLGPCGGFAWSFSVATTPSEWFDLEVDYDEHEFRARYTYVVYAVSSSFQQEVDPFGTGHRRYFEFKSDIPSNIEAKFFRQYEKLGNRLSNSRPLALPMQAILEPYIHIWWVEDALPNPSLVENIVANNRYSFRTVASANDSVLSYFILETRRLLGYWNGPDVELDYITDKSLAANFLESFVVPYLFRLTEPPLQAFSRKILLVLASDSVTRAIRIHGNDWAALIVPNIGAFTSKNMRKVLTEQLFQWETVLAISGDSRLSSLTLPYSEILPFHVVEQYVYGSVYATVLKFPSKARSTYFIAIRNALANMYITGDFSLLGAHLYMLLQ